MAGRLEEPVEPKEIDSFLFRGSLVLSRQWDTGTLPSSEEPLKPCEMKGRKKNNGPSADQRDPL